jgi:hypothetical protein
MSFRFKEKDRIIKYFETEMGLNNVKINKIIKDIEEIENNKTTNNDYDSFGCYECLICESDYKVSSCSYCGENMCGDCAKYCKECKSSICSNCFIKDCPICYDVCDLCDRHEKKLIPRSIRSRDDSIYYFDICSDCNKSDETQYKLEIKVYDYYS